MIIIICYLMILINRWSQNCLLSMYKIIHVFISEIPNFLVNRFLPCKVVLYDKGGTIQRAGCQLPGDRLRWLI